MGLVEQLAPEGDHLGLQILQRDQQFNSRNLTQQLVHPTMTQWGY